MSKKKTLFLLLAVLLALVAAVIIGMTVHFNTVRSFSLSDDYYQEHIQQFASDRTVEPISSAKEAKQTAEEIWTEVYGADTILDERPYVVYFDESEDVWFVTGTLPLFSLGGTAKILIQTDGTVLAVWHEK